MSMLIILMIFLATIVGVEAPVFVVYKREEDLYVLVAAAAVLALSIVGIIFT